MSDCTFTNCSAYGSGGAIGCKYLSSLVANGCSFSDCTSAASYAGAVYLYYVTACTVVKDSIFQNCSVDREPAGGAYLSKCNLSGSGCDGESSGIVSGCLFTLCSTTGNGGGL